MHYPPANPLLNPTYRYLRLSQCRWNVQILRDVNVTKVVPIFDAPHRQPIDIVYGQIAGQLNLDVLALVASQRFQRANFVRNFDTHDVRLGSVAYPEVCVRPGTVVVQVRDVEGFRIQDADVARPETVGEPFKLGQNAWLGNVQARWDEHFAKVDLEERGSNDS